MPVRRDTRRIARGRAGLRALAVCTALTGCTGGPGPVHLSFAPQELVAPPRDLLAGPLKPPPSMVSAADDLPAPLPPDPPPQARRRYAVHLASYRTLANLRRGWALLRREDPGDLAELRPDIARVDLGPEKGIFYRLKAGPLPDRAEAERLCRRLKQHGLYCTVMRFTG